MFHRTFSECTLRLGQRTHISHAHSPRNWFHLAYCFGVIEGDSIPKNFWSGTYRGKRNLILVFYVGDNTPDCNRQLTSLQEERETLEACNAAVLGINPGTLDDHQRYQAQLGLTFPLLHDPGAQVAALYGARQEDGTVRRTVYLIDTQ